MVKLTYYGHACWMAEVCGKKLLFDPFISMNPLAEEIIIEDIRPDYILISHGHGDHVADAEKIAKASNATLISNFEIVNWFANKGLEKTHPMNIGGKWRFDFGTLTYFTAQHSSVMPDGQSGGNPGSFIIESSDGTFYYAGDTALMMDMKLIPMLTKLDFALLPIGDNFTMGYKEAILASDFIQCNKIVAMHYDTFGYIKIDKNLVNEAFNKAEKDLIFVEIGKTITL